MGSLFILHLMRRWIAPFFLFMPATIFAQEHNLYIIDSIPLDVKASTNIQAKTRALVQGKKIAFSTILCRVTARENCKNFNPTPIEIDALIRDFSIQDEQFGAGVYRAQLKVSFREKELIDFFKEKNLSYSVTQARPALLLPVWRDEDGLALWTPKNLWLASWSLRPTLINGLTPLRRVDWNARDRDLLPAIDKAPKDFEPFRDISRNYNLDGIVLSFATPVRDPAGVIETLHLDTIIFHPDLPPFQPQRAVKRRQKQSDKDFFAEAQNVLLQTIEENWKQKNFISVTKKNFLTVAVVFNDHQEWNRLRDKLLSSAQIDAITVKRLSLQIADVEFSFAGTEAQLQANLLRLGFLLEKNEKGWQFSTSEG